MPSDKVETFKVPDDIKATIGKMIALQSLATDPGQKISLSGELINWVMAGLVVRYGRDKVPDAYLAELTLTRDLWIEALNKYMTGGDYWGQALMRIRDVSGSMIVIAAVEQLIDYKQMEYDFTAATYGPSAYQLEDESARDRAAGIGMRQPPRPQPQKGGMPTL